MPKVKKPHKFSFKRMSNSDTLLGPTDRNFYTPSIGSLVENDYDRKYYTFKEPNYLMYENYDSEKNYVMPKNSENNLEKCTLSFAKGKQIIEDIIASIVNNQTDRIDCSSSQCESEECIAQGKSMNSNSLVDKRLEQWQKTLKDRRRIARHMKRKLGRKPEDLLFNRMVSVDEHNKDTVKRLIDYAERMNPTRLITKKRVILPEYCNYYTKKHLHELRETIPKSEREKNKNFELCGIPTVVRNEIMGKMHYNDVDDAKTARKSLWLQSKILEQHIKEKKDDIKRVIEFFPDFDNLQVIGQGIFIPKVETLMVRPSDIELINEEKLIEISSDT